MHKPSSVNQEYLDGHQSTAQTRFASAMVPLEHRPNKDLP